MTSFIFKLLLRFSLMITFLLVYGNRRLNNIRSLDDGLNEINTQFQNFTEDPFSLLIEAGIRILAIGMLVTLFYKTGRRLESMGVEMTTSFQHAFRLLQTPRRETLITAERSNEEQLDLSGIEGVDEEENGIDTLAPRFPEVSEAFLGVDIGRLAEQAAAATAAYLIGSNNEAESPQGNGLQRRR